MPSVITPVALDILPSWPTHRLLGFRDKLLRCEARLDTSDVQHLSELDPTRIRFKDDPRWTELYEATLQLLRTHEHVLSGQKHKLTRQARAKRRPDRGGRSK